MQTHVQAPAPAAIEQTRQQHHQPEYETDSAQLLRTPQFEDGRPEVTAQLNQQSLMANSPRTTQLKAMQAMMANSPRVSQLQATQAMMAASPRVQQLKTSQSFIAAGTLAKQNHHASAAPITQRMEDEEPLQSMAEEPVQREQTETSATDPTPQDAPPSETPKPNSTGLPDHLKTGIENLSGISMDHVKVHYNSDKPAQLQAHAYAQGGEIHVAPGQEKHLPHEAWHVVQQAQGRVRPTVQMKVGSEGKGAVPEAGLTEQGAIQCVLIDGTEITKSTPLDEIIEVLGWARYAPMSESLSAEQIAQLREELRDHSERATILEEFGDLDSGDDDEEEDEKPAEAYESKESMDDVANEFNGEAVRLREAAADGFGWGLFPDNFKGMKKIGVHETSDKNVQSLVARGPAISKMDTGHHLGKGKGFYATHVGNKNLKTVTRGVSYGEQFVAIYVPESMEEVWSKSEESNHTHILEKIHKGKNCYYRMTGGSEIIIPARCFSLVKVVSLPDQMREWGEAEDEEISGDEEVGAVEEFDDEEVGEEEVDDVEEVGHVEATVPSLSSDEEMRLAVYRDELRIVGEMNLLSTNYNNARSASARERIADRWSVWETLLFRRWSANGKLYTLWLSVSRVGEFIDEPRDPLGE